MNLEDVNKKLAEIAEELPAKIKEFQRIEYDYEMRYFWLFAHSMASNLAGREAEAKLTCKEEGLIEPLQNIRGDVRGLYHKKDCYIAIGSNLRALQIVTERDAKYERMD